MYPYLHGARIWCYDYLSSIQPLTEIYLFPYHRSDIQIFTNRNMGIFDEQTLVIFGSQDTCPVASFMFILATPTQEGPCDYCNSSVISEDLEKDE